MRTVINIDHQSCFAKYPTPIFKHWKLCTVMGPILKQSPQRRYWNRVLLSSTRCLLCINLNTFPLGPSSGWLPLQRGSLAGFTSIWLVQGPIFAAENVAKTLMTHQSLPRFRQGHSHLRAVATCATQQELLRGRNTAVLTPVGFKTN